MLDKQKFVSGIRELPAIILDDQLNIKAIKRKHGLYELEPIMFFILPIAVTVTGIMLLLFKTNISGYVAIGLPLLIFIINDHFIFGRRYGWWVFNYSVIGNINLKPETITIDIQGKITNYEISKLSKIQLKFNSYQNHYRHRDIVRDGIGSLLIDNGNTKFVTYFLLEKQSQLNEFETLKNEWKQRGLTVWT